MKRGNLRTQRDYKQNIWKIQGRKNGIWVDAWDEEREEKGLPKDLIFDLEYDACGYLLSFVDHVNEQKRYNIQNKSPLKNRSEKIKPRNRTRTKMIKKSKQRNRKK